MTDDDKPFDDAVGSAAQEAIRLLGALQDWARRSSSALGEQVATGSPECRLCPVCQVLGLVRHADPEVFDHLSDAASSLAAAFRAAAASHTRAWSTRPESGAQHIDVR